MVGCIRLCLCRDLGPPGPGPLSLSLCPALSPLPFLSHVPVRVPARRSPLLAQRSNLSSDEGDSAGLTARGGREKGRRKAATGE